MKRIIGLFLLVVFSSSAFATGARLPAEPKVLVIGDSLSSAHGLRRDEGWVHLLQQRLEARGYPHVVVNRSRHGMTTKRALRDVAWYIETMRPDVVLIELGGVDAFLNMPIGALRENLREIAGKASESGARVALFEMALPPGAKDVRYAHQFRGMYHEVAQVENARLVPFFLASFADSPEKFQPDGIHPRAEVQIQMLNAAWPTVQKLLKPPPQQLRVSAPLQHASDAGGSD